MGVYANLEAIEGDISGTRTHTFERKSRQIILTNDSGTDNLQYRFGGSESYATLYPTESITLGVWIRNIHLKSSTLVDYRLWVYG